MYLGKLISIAEKPAHHSVVKFLFDHILSICIFFIGFLIVASTPADSIQNPAAPWEEYRNENGIIGFERKFHNSKYLETRAETIIDTPIEVILEILEDITSYPRWMYNCKEAILLELNGDSSRVLYLVQEAPLGSPDRDVVITANSSADWNKGTYTISLQSNDKYQYPKVEVDEKRQRMTEFKGTWELKIIDRNHTKVIYTAFSDPGGFAPGFIVNSMIRKVSFLTLKGMIPMASKDRYIKSSKRSNVKNLVETHLMSEK